MPSKVALLRTSPATVLADYESAMHLADYQSVLDSSADTALKINISWHFFYPGSSTTPWQLEGVIRAMERDGFRKELEKRGSRQGKPTEPLAINTATISVE